MVLEVAMTASDFVLFPKAGGWELRVENATRSILFDTDRARALNIGLGAAKRRGVTLRIEGEDEDGASDPAEAQLSAA
jgi:hypothetical protein